MIKQNIIFIYIFIYYNIKTQQNKRTLYKQVFI